MDGNWAGWEVIPEFTDMSSEHILATLGGLQSRLTEWLGVEADLSSAAWMRSSVSERAQCEAIVAF